jgi:hypothetical protein
MSKNDKHSKGKAGVNAPAASAKKGAPAAPKRAQGATPEGSQAQKSSAKDAKAAGAGAAAAPKRKLGLRGAAPWAARHAAKHAAEARARAAQPPPPGSARATIRVPTGAEEIKAKIAELHNALVQIRGFRKNLAKNFHDVGTVLRDVQARKLYEAKGYGSFEAFLEREIDIGKTTALKLVRVSAIFLKEATQEYGMDRIRAALSALDSAAEPKQGSSPPPPANQAAKLPLPLKPPVSRVG